MAALGQVMADTANNNSNKNKTKKAGASTTSATTTSTTTEKAEAERPRSSGGGGGGRASSRRELFSRRAPGRRRKGFSKLLPRVRLNSGSSRQHSSKEEDDAINKVRVRNH